jgi:hypothetical protein
MMKRWLKSIAGGVFIQGLLLFIALQTKSGTVACALLWQACLIDAISSHHREFPVLGIIGVILGALIYSILVYAVLGKTHFFR